MQPAITPPVASFEPRSTTPQRPGHPSSSAFGDYFSEENIIRELCRWRVTLARRRNEKLFLHRIRANAKVHVAHQYEDMFPPRRQWHAKRQRSRGSSAGADLNLIALERTVLAQRLLPVPPPSVGRMNAFIVHLQQRALHAPSFVFDPPKIIEDRKERGRPEHRPIAVFPLEDKIIGCLTARYLRNCLDPVFDDACLAFRCARNGQPPPRHHDAVATLIDVRNQNAGRPLYVAECDIQGFFDCVDHRLARQALNEVIAEREEQVGTSVVDPRARQIFSAYLDCYTFPRNVLGEAEPNLKTRKPDAFFKWPTEALLRFHKSPRDEAIGVPQGGALSSVVVNCLLHRADRALRTLTVSVPFTYLRYCDDMIIVSTSRRSCKRAFKTYCDVLAELKLPLHKPERAGRYGKAFWKGKSRHAYRWAPPFLWFSRSPWIQFVGYQIRHDGLLRIRKKSFDKHIHKIIDAANQLLTHIRTPGPSAPKVRRNRRQIVHRFRMRILSMGVGRRKLADDIQGPLPMSWCSGFVRLQDQPFVSAQLKALDRHRESQVRRVEKALGNQQLPQQGQPNRLKIRAPRFYGHPFSYFGQFRSTLDMRKEGG